MAEIDKIVLQSDNAQWISTSDGKIKLVLEFDFSLVRDNFDAANVTIMKDQNSLSQMTNNLHGFFEQLFANGFLTNGPTILKFGNKEQSILTVSIIL